jgi:hypothetical protein
LIVAPYLNVQGEIVSPGNRNACYNTQQNK